MLSKLTAFVPNGKCGVEGICISRLLGLPCLSDFCVSLFVCSVEKIWRVFVVKLRLRDNESVNEAVRRFRKLVEHAGVKKEMRKREFYEKPSDIRRRDRRRAEMRARRANQPPELEVQ